MYPFNLFLGPLRMTNYNLFHFLGLALLVICEVTLLDKDALVKRWQVLVACTIGITVGITGSKLTHLLLFAEEYRGISPEEVLVISGHAYIGGACLALLAIYILFRYYKVGFLYAGDYTLPYFGLFRAFGRIGCLLTGCCHGSVSNLPWACYFRDGLLRHPAQAYMVILTFSIYIAGRSNYRRLRDTPGIIFFSSVMMYGLGRFFVEFFRVDSPYILGPIKLSHIVLIVVFIYGTSGLYILYRKYKQMTAIAPLIRHLFSTFGLSVVIMSAGILTIVSVVPKLNYTDDIGIRIGRAGITKVEPVRTIDSERIEKIKRALERYKHDIGLYPTQEQGLEALIERPTSRPIPADWHGPYIDSKLLLSKSGQPYKYIPNRYGDTWSYQIIAPFRKKDIFRPTKKKRDYALKVEVHHALVLYRLDNQRYPTQQQGIEALIEKPTIPPIPQNWKGPYLKLPLKNKKGKPYRYKIEERGGKEAYYIYTE